MTLNLRMPEIFCLQAFILADVAFTDFCIVGPCNEWIFDSDISVLRPCFELTLHRKASELGPCERDDVA